MTPKKIRDDPHPLDSYVDRKEAARLLGIRPATLADYAIRGCGPPFAKIGRSIRYPLRGLQQWAESRTVTSTAKFGRSG